jgi:hypothetical protein
MNTSSPANQNDITNPDPKTVCLASCRKILTQIEQTKNTILAEFREAIEQHEHLLHLALNEAEALAWQTDFPQLVFPTLASEKAQTVAAWYARQKSMLRTNSSLAFAA